MSLMLCAMPGIASGRMGCALLLATLHQAVLAQDAGLRTFERSCVSCHAGAARAAPAAPKVGERAKWAALNREGQAVVTAHGWVGIRGMPAKGGQPELDLQDFAVAVVYMANASGQKWPVPNAEMLGRINVEIEMRRRQLEPKRK